MLKITNIVGARPNFMKIAPLVRAMARQPVIQSCLVHTGQHYDDKLSDVFFKQLGIPAPDINLGIGSASRDEQIARISAAFEPIMIEQQPDAVLVVGDVNSTIACAQVARNHGVKVVHVEAGLRSFDQAMPEEHNRVQTDQISDFLFVTEESGMENLEKERVPGKRYLVGNCMVDSLIQNLGSVENSSILDHLSVSPRQYMVATFHRPSNVDTRDALSRLVETLGLICGHSRLVLPLHPRTRKSAENFGLLDTLEKMPGLILTDPLGYHDFIRLVRDALAVVTDSGGIQEESTYLRVPCLTMRENTERPVTVTIGTNTLLGSNRAALLAAVDSILRGTYKKGDIPPLWDGHAAERIVEILLRELPTA